MRLIIGGATRVVLSMLFSYTVSKNYCSLQLLLLFMSLAPLSLSKTIFRRDGVLL